jgi:hypothetical protein
VQVWRAESGKLQGQFNARHSKVLAVEFDRVRRSLDNEANEVIAPKHNKVRTVPLSPAIASALASYRGAVCG